MQKIQTLTESGAYETIEAVAVGDVTGDGRDDLIVQPFGNVLRIYVQQSDGTLDAPLEFRYRSDDNYVHRKSVVLADFNGDGVLDVAASGLDEPSWHHGLVNLLLSAPGGALVHRQALTTVEQPTDHWSALDVDGDGAMDIVASDNVSDYSGGAECGPGRFSCPRMRVMYGDGKGDFPRMETVQLGEPFSVTNLPAVDVDGDGLRDVVYSLREDAGGIGRTVARLRQAGGGLGVPVPLFEGPIGAGRGQTPGDFNSDGRMDFVASMRLYARGPAGGYGETVLPTNTVRSYWDVAADFDGDGLADLATVQMTPGFPAGKVYVVIYQQRDGGLNRHYFSDHADELDQVSFRPNSLAAGDINGDGCRDLVIAASYQGVLIFPGRNCARQETPPLAICDLREAAMTQAAAAAPSTPVHTGAYPDEMVR